MKPGVSAALLLSGMALLVAVPVAARRSAPEAPANAAQVIVVSPHNEQIRQEFGRAYSEWHQREFGQPATVIWNSPGGTSEIRKTLVASYTAALRAHKAPGGNADVLFGGGSFEFDQMAQPLVVDGQITTTSILEPLPFSPEFLKETYGEPTIAGRRLYHAGGAWYGSALSAFGIVYNTEVLARLHVDPPTGWTALADPRLEGWVALVNPAQSGSVATAMETILLREGWVEGWRIMRRAGGNARSISGSATRAPVEVAQGEAAEAFAIDFYGRFQQQAVADGGSPDRVGYIDPVDKTTVDPDPIALLTGAPHREEAERFIRFVLSPEGQRLWQYRAGSPGGPQQFELRRLPVHQAVIAKDMDRFVDKVDPRQIVRTAPPDNKDVRDFVTPLFVAMTMDNRSLLRQAWACIARHPAYPKDGSVATADMVKDPQLAAMLRAFDMLPSVAGPDGKQFDLNDPSVLAEVRAGWLKGGWKGKGLWDPLDAPADVLRQQFAAFFREQFQRVIQLAQGRV